MYPCQRTFKGRRLSLSSRPTRTGGTSAGIMPGIGGSPSLRTFALGNGLKHRLLYPLRAVFFFVADLPPTSAPRCLQVATPPRSPESNRRTDYLPPAGSVQSVFRSLDVIWSCALWVALSPKYLYSAAILASTAASYDLKLPMYVFFPSCFICAVQKCFLRFQ